MGNCSTTVTNAVAIGYNAGAFLAGAFVQSVAIGTEALSGASFAAGNMVTIGYQSGKAVTNGVDGTFIGHQSGVAVTSGASNTFVGSGAGVAVNTGGVNTLVGYFAGFQITTGSNNTIVGPYAGLTTLAGNVALATGAGTRRFWHDGTDAFVSHATTANAANAVLDSGTNALQRSTSSRRYKRNIKPLDAALADAALKIEAVTYQSACDCDDKDREFIGVIAEQAVEVAPHLIHWGYAPEDYEEPDKNGERWPKKGAIKVPDGFAYDRLTVHLLSIVQRQNTRIATLEAKLG